MRWDRWDDGGRVSKPNVNALVLKIFWILKSLLTSPLIIQGCPHFFVCVDLLFKWETHRDLPSENFINYKIHILWYNNKKTIMFYYYSLFTTPSEIVPQAVWSVWCSRMHINTTDPHKLLQHTRPSVIKHSLYSTTWIYWAVFKQKYEWAESTHTQFVLLVCASFITDTTHAYAQSCMSL